MLSKGERICPCCGKLLELIAPTKELLSNRFGVSQNEIPFYIPSGIRYVPYTVHPKTLSDFWGINVENVGNIGEFWLCNNTMSSDAPRHRSRLRLITVPRTERALKKDRLFSGSGWAMSFFCQNCNARLALNYNPHTIFDGMLFWGVFSVSMLLAVLLMGINVVISIIPIAMCSVAPLFSLFSYVFIKNFFSNFIVTDLRDNLMIPKAEFRVSREGLKRIFLHRSNVYETELDGEKFYLYLTEKGKNDLKMHICGIEGEQEALLSIIREKQSRGETVTLPLTFEGKLVGAAEVLKTE